jgi:hypothetical protein
MSEGLFLGATIAGIAWVLIGLACLIGAFAIYDYLISQRKGHGYRKFVTNLYISGKIRDIADKDSVDLKKEYLEYLKFNKLNSDRRRKELDEEIEEALAEKTTKSIHSKDKFV